MKKIDLSILNNADDDILEKLVPFSSDRETRERVFNMSERKFDKMMNGHDSDNDYSMTVEGVETYHRPVWYRFVGAAAAFAVIAGGIGATAHFMPKRIGTEVENNVEATTEVLTEELTTEAYTAVPMTSEVLSNDEMKQLFDDNLDVYFEAVALTSDTKTDTAAEPVQLWRYWGDYDENMDEGFYDGLKRVGDSFYYPETYYKVKDPRYNDIEELKNYYRQYIYEPEREFGMGIDVSGCTDDMVITQNENYLDIIGYNGAIYSTQHLVTYLPADEADRGEVICDKPLYVTPTSFTWERIYKVYNAEIGGEKVDVKAESVELDFEKMSDGSWKVTNGEVSGAEYDSSVDYYGLDTVFSMAGGAYLSPNTGLDFETANLNASDYLMKNNDREQAFYFLWERASTLPENYEHITDDYVNDNNWLKFTYREAYNTDGPELDIYTDCNGTVFAAVKR